MFVCKRYIRLLANWQHDRVCFTFSSIHILYIHMDCFPTCNIILLENKPYIFGSGCNYSSICSLAFVCRFVPKVPNFEFIVIYAYLTFHIQWVNKL